MAPRSSGVSGLAVGIAAAGGVMLYSAVKNVRVVDALRDILGGKNPGTSGTATGPALKTVKTNVDAAIVSMRTVTKTASQSAPAAGSARALADVARGYIGVPYVWGGTTSAGLDCSGLVCRCLWDLNVKVGRLITTGFLVWDGATTIPRSECAEGDLACWAGHIGIAISNTEMIHAPNVGSKVQVGSIYGTPVIRRVKL